MSVCIEDEDGKEITVTLEGEGLKQREYKCTKDDIEEMVFVTDQYNISDRGYHDLASRHESLPRSSQVKTPREEINELCEDLKEVSGRHDGYWKSLSESLTRVLSNPDMSHLIPGGKVRIKFSGYGTRVGE